MPALATSFGALCDIPTDNHCVPDADKPLIRRTESTCYPSRPVQSQSLFNVSMTQTNARPLTFAIVGCGLIGWKRAAALAQVHGTRLLYACDLDGAKAEKLAKAYPACRAATDFKIALADKDLLAVIVSTVNSSLAPVALASAEAGKHVLVEKP